MVDFSIEIGLFSAAGFRAENVENMICFKYGAIIYFTFNILYETYDSILQYVHFSANSHNFHIYNNFDYII